MNFCFLKDFGLSISGYQANNQPITTTGGAVNGKPPIYNNGSTSKPNNHDLDVIFGLDDFESGDKHDPYYDDSSSKYDSAYMGNTNSILPSLESNGTKPKVKLTQATQ